MVRDPIMGGDVGVRHGVTPMLFTPPYPWVMSWNLLKFHFRQQLWLYGPDPHDKTHSSITSRTPRSFKHIVLRHVFGFSDCFCCLFFGVGPDDPTLPQCSPIHAVALRWWVRRECNICRDVCTKVCSASSARLHVYTGPAQEKHVFYMRREFNDFHV